LHLGAQWLVGREDRAEWAHIWQALLKNHDVLPEELPLHELLHLGARWLAGHDETEEWGFICERLLEQQFQAADFFEHAASWLNRSRKKPEWPLLAAKFIVVVPQHAASAEFAAILIQRIKTCPNNSHWFKTVSLVANRLADSNLPQEVHDWLRVLNSRTELPAWAEVRRCLDEGFPLKGLVTVPKGKHSYVVELEIGLIAICSEHRNGFPIAKGNTYEFFVQSLNVEKGFVLVGLDKPVVLEVGQSYEGCVSAKMTYGLRVAIGGRQGLLHHTQCPDGTNFVRALPVGSQICVEILALDDKGPKLRYAGPQLKSGILAEELTVGCTYDAVITGIKEFGIFLRIGTRAGLLHRSQLSPNADIFSQYRVGQQHVVQVINIQSDGKVSFVFHGR